MEKLFETDIIHIGGDECPIDHYKKCPDCCRWWQDSADRHPGSVPPAPAGCPALPDTAPPPFPAGRCFYKKCPEYRFCL